MEAPVAKGVVDEGKASEQGIEVASCRHTNEGIGTVGTDCAINPFGGTALAADGQGQPPGHTGGPLPAVHDGV